MKPVQADCQTVDVQADEEDIGRELAQRHKDATKEIEDVMDGNKGWEGLTTIVDLDWPDTCYKNTAAIDHRTLRDQRGSIAILTSPNMETSREGMENIKFLISSFPEVTSLMEENLQEGTESSSELKQRLLQARARRGKYPECYICFRIPCPLKG